MKTGKILAFAFVLLAGCQMTDDIQEEKPDAAVVQRYTAVIEGAAITTRTELDGNRVLWSAGDSIVVFDGSDTGMPYLIDPAYSGRMSAEFQAVEGRSVDGSGDETDAVVAYYPYASDLTLSANPDGSLTLGNVLFPSEQQYAPASFAEASFPMASIASEGANELSFLNLGGVLRLMVKGKGSVSKVILEGNAAEPISGSASVVLKHGSAPVVTMNDDAAGSISLICDPMVELSEDKPVEFNISLPPVEFNSGFTVTFEYGEKGSLVKQTSKSNSVHRSGLLIMPEFTLEDMSGPFVDLGLSVKWASMNVGASSPEEYGNYYAWGETEKKSSYSKGNYTYFDLPNLAYMDIGEDISGTEYDAATVNWGEGWRMPTMAELQELVDKCDWMEARVNRVGGNRITGPNGNSIFVPNTGYWQNSSKYFDDDYPEGKFGLFWSATLDPAKKEEVYIMNCESGNGIVAYRYWYRHFGLPVRPVRD